MFVGVAESGAGSDGQHTVQRYEIAWPPDGGEPKFQERARINSAGFAQAIWPRPDVPHVRLPTIVEERSNATDMKLENLAVRVFHLEPLVLTERAAPASWTGLTEASEDCVELRDHIDRQAQQAASNARQRGVSSEQVPKVRMLQGRLPDSTWVCVLVTRRAGPSGTNSALSVYRAVPNRPDENKRVPIFPEIDFGAGELSDFRLGTSGEYDGWLAAQRADKQWIGTPWSLDAWQRFAGTVCNFEAVSGLDQRRYAPVFDLIRGTDAPLAADNARMAQEVCGPRAASR
jgi:hypothetical protein